MDIFEFALEKEKLSEDYYRRLAGKTANKGLRAIFVMLANEEARHRVIVSKMKEDADAEVSQTDVLSDAKEVFMEMREAVEKFNFDISELELYKRAQDIEDKAGKFYSQKAREVDKEQQKEIFLSLAEEEKKHYFLLDNIIEFMLRPERWLENAEFVHLDEY